MLAAGRRSRWRPCRSARPRGLRRKIATPGLSELGLLRLPLFDWTPGDFSRATAVACQLTVHFHDYLIRGGFPAAPGSRPTSGGGASDGCSARTSSRRSWSGDMTAAATACARPRGREALPLPLLPRRRYPGACDDLERTRRREQADGAELPRPGSRRLYLTYRLKPFGYGKEVLREATRFYLADALLPEAPSCSSASGSSEQPERLGAAVETAFFKHLFTRYYRETPTFSYFGAIARTATTRGRYHRRPRRAARPIRGEVPGLGDRHAQLRWARVSSWSSASRPGLRDLRIAWRISASSTCPQCQRAAKPPGMCGRWF